VSEIAAFFPERRL